MNERYKNLDGFRAFAAIGLILMHIRGNGSFGISGFVYDDVILSFTNLTFFFMLLSAFSMCCGYYDKIKNNGITVEQFYKRRYERIWPFFALLCTVELIVDHSIESLYEWFADLSLTFGLLPNANISVVGVGWFIGIVFVFYMVFPFFVFLIGNKKRAWFVFLVTVILNILCQLYFMDSSHVVDGYTGRVNILYSSMFFVAGGLIYLYLDKIKNLKHGWVVGVITVPVIVFYYFVSSSDYTLLLLFILLAVFGICIDGPIAKAVFQNKIIKYIASVSLELYLSHMFVYRALERLNMLHLTKSEVLNYIIVSFLVIIGAIILSFIINTLINRIKIILKQRRVQNEDFNG